MSRTLQRVVDGFFKGWQLGLQGMHYEDMRADRKEQREIARNTAAAAERRHQERMGIDRMKADAYVEQARANAARLRAKAAGGGGGAGGPSGAAAGFLDDMTQVGLDVSVPERQPSYVTVQPDDSPSVGEPPASSTVTEDARGGKIPAAARGGTMRRIGGAMANAMTSGANAVMRRDAAAPPQQTPGPIIRRSSTQTYPGQVQPPVPGGAGTSGPGSGYGDNAAPPVSYQPQAIQPQVPAFDPTAEGTYARGGRVKRFEKGGRMMEPFTQYGETMMEPRTRGGEMMMEPKTRNNGEPMMEPRTRGGGEPMMQDRRGPVRRYQSGGEVVIGPDGYPVPTEPRWQPQHDWAREGAVEQIRQRRLARNVTGQPGSEDQTAPPPYVSEDDQAREAAAGRNPNPSVRNWVPPTQQARQVSGTQQSWQGETDRADETLRPDPYMHDESQGSPLQTYPDAGGAPSNGRGNGAIRTGPPQRLQLGDQRRTAAYDPEADRMDPRNTGIVEPGGAVNERVYRGLQTTKGDNAGPFGDRLDRPGAQPQPARAEDYASAAVTFAQRSFPQDPQGKAALFNGAGSPDPRTTAQLLQVVDPKGQMPIGDRITRAAQAAYQFHKEQGNEAEAQKAAFEVTQYGVGKSREHGVAAIKLAQGGNLQGAVEELTKGYEWLPNGQRAVVQNNQIVVLGKDGKQTMALPLSPQAVQNLAMGMATGQLGWDVMRHAGSPTPPAAPPDGQLPSRQIIPGTSRPAAQPPAAPAGPATTPAAPPTQRPAASPSSQPPQAVQTTAPTAPAGPPRPTQGAAPPPAPAQPLPSSTQAPAQRGGPPPATPPQGDNTSTEQDEKKQREADEKALRDWYAKNPDKPPPGTIARETAQDPKDQVALQKHRETLTKRYADERAWIIKRAQERGLKKGDSKYLTEALKTHKARYDAMFKEIDDQSKAYRTEQNAQDRYDRETALKPRQVTYDQEKQVEQQLTTRMDQQTKDKQFKAANQNTVLRYQFTPTQRTEFTQLAKELWRQNSHLSVDRAHDLAIAMTAIKPDGEGLNGNKGKDALQYRVDAGNARRGYRVVTPSGERLNVDHNSHRQLRQIQLQNWHDYETKKGKADADKKEFGERTKNLAIRLAPMLPPPLGSIVGGSSTLVK